MLVKELLQLNELSNDTLKSYLDKRNSTSDAEAKAKQRHGSLRTNSAKKDAEKTMLKHANSRADAENRLDAREHGKTTAREYGETGEYNKKLGRNTRKWSEPEEKEHLKVYAKQSASKREEIADRDTKHKAELDELAKKHKAELDELAKKHKAERDS